MKRAALLFGFARQHLWSYVIGAVLLAATLWMTFAIPRYLQQAIDILGADPDPAGSPFLNRIGWILAFALAIVVARTGSRIFFHVPGRRVEYALKNQMLAHLTRLQRPFYLEHPSGGIISRINNDINGVRMLLGAGFMMLLSAVGNLSLAPYYMYQISPRLTLYCALPIGLGFLALQLGLRRMRREQLRQMRSLQGLSEFTVESFNGIDVLKSYRDYDWAQARFGGLSGEVRDAAIRMSTVRAYLMPLLLHIANGLKVLLVLVGGTLVVREGMTIGQFTAYTLYLSMLVSPLMGMTFLLFVLQRGFTGLTSLLEVLDTEPGLPPPDPEARRRFSEGLARRVGETGEAGGGPAQGSLREGLVVTGLAYCYPDEPERKVLSDIDLTVTPGEVVGILGSVGSGKSTLVNLINGFLTPPPGSVRLDGVDANELGHDYLRAHVITVTQEPFLFSDTIFENVGFAVDSPTREAVERACRAASLESDLQRMPAGVQTLVGEKGITLSGGQKQRISLARATLKSCDLLILDDVLSAVDQETERFLIDRIYQFQGARSTLLVSHRISALARADRVLVLEAGRIVATGTHAELIRVPGPYQEAWRLQSEAEPPAPESTPDATPGAIFEALPGDSADITPGEIR